MPKPRKHHKDLPKGMTFKNGAYYYRIKQKWIRLSDNRREAFIKYAELTANVDKPYMLIDLLQAYKEEIGITKSLATQRHYDASILRLSITFKNFTIEDVEPHDIYMHMDFIAKKTVNGANKDKSYLSVCFELAIRKGIRKINPCDSVKKITEQPRSRLIKSDEFKAMHDNSSLLIQNMMDFAYITKLRRSEILSIRLSDITDEGIKVYASKTKTDYIVLWSDKLRALVTKIKADRNTKRASLYLFANGRGLPYSPDGFSAIWQRYMAKALTSGKLKERFTFHDIRAMAVTYTAKHEGLKAASLSAGHSSESITSRVYVRDAIPRKPTE